jgi:osmoprotectant transport system ATP-binding protein
VASLDLAIPEGELVCLIGPSGCGKTTTMKMINRLVEPTSGRILLGDEDVTRADPVQLRRRIGYVIQQVGLFAHETIADNVATVPKLLGWNRARTKARVNELLELVGLEPDTFAKRYPAQLSGGQRQRVGVARALAADPPVLLMDEPFSAIDPIARARLQAEFQRIQGEVHKTIVFVTHDVDEAVRLGDRIAVFRQGGHLEQYAPPDELLAEPASDFVADFLGAERGLKRLALIPVSAVKAESGPVVTPDDPGQRAVAAAEAYGSVWVVVVDADRRLLGWVHAGEAAERGRVGDAAVRPFQLQVQAADSLRAALNAMVQSRTGVAVRVSDGDRYEGIVTMELLSKEIS